MFLNGKGDVDYSKVSGSYSAKTINLMSNAMSYAYNDRNTNLGDPDFVKMDLDKFLSKKYAKQIA